MSKSFIINYVKNLTVNDLKKFAINNNIDVTDNDVNTIYNFIQKYNDVFFDDPMYYIKMLNGKISDNVYNEILNAYKKYREYL